MLFLEAYMIFCFAQEKSERERLESQVTEEHRLAQERSTLDQESWAFPFITNYNGPVFWLCYWCAGRGPQGFSPSSYELGLNPCGPRPAHQ